MAPGARAAGGVKRVGVEGGFAGVAGSDGDFSGYGGGVVGDWALNDAWALSASALVTSNQVARSGGRSRIASQSLGFTYALDVIQLVPYVGLYAGLYEIGGGGVGATHAKVGAQLALGVDYLYSRELVLGIELRAHALPADFRRSPDNPTPFYATTFLKVQYAWGWF
ncbi:MAG: hypothetical protein NVS3B10_30170 [Polyangiales bacterium]